MTRSAGQAAVRIVESITSKNGPGRELEARELFAALHACAYRSTRQPGKEHVSEAESKEWAGRWQLIREYIIERNLGLVYSMFRRFASGTCDQDDLLSDAMLGLTHAVDRFNPWKGYRFSTYACNVIIRDLRRRGRHESSYRQRFWGRCDDLPDWSDRVPDSRTELYLERLQRALHGNLGGLTELESQVIARRFPDDQKPRMTFQKIGGTVGLSKERVRQIQNAALRKLREVLSEDPVLQGN